MMRIKESIQRRKLIHEMNEEYKEFDFEAINCELERLHYVVYSSNSQGSPKGMVVIVGSTTVFF